MRRNCGYILVIIAFLALGLNACSPVVRPADYKPLPWVSIDEAGTVHINEPCATLTPYTTYRDFDFMRLGTLIGGSGWVITGSDAVQVPYGHTLIPPEEAKIVFGGYCP